VAAVAISRVRAPELSHAWRIAAALREGLGSDYVAIHVRCGGSRYTVDPNTTVAAVPYDDGYATEIPDAVLAELRALREACVLIYKQSFGSKLAQPIFVWVLWA
jgi:hypothetical protein